MLKHNIGCAHQAFNRRSTCGLGRACQRNMAFASHQARGGIQAHPACAWQIHLAPRMQIGEIVGGAARAIERFDIWRELDQVARNKARRQAAVAQQIHQQPSRITARTPC